MAGQGLALHVQRPCCSQVKASRAGLSCRAQAARAPKSAPTNPKNSIGIHSQVWVGGWSPEEAEKAISGTKDAGFDLIERELFLSSAGNSCYWQTVRQRSSCLIAAGLASLTLPFNCDGCLSPNWWSVRAVNVSEPDKFDAALTKDLLQKYGIKGSGSLVSALVCTRKS